MRQAIDIDYVSKAIVGIASPVVGVITSFQEQIEWVRQFVPGPLHALLEVNSAEEHFECLGF
jgi:hypothetical protein